MSKVASSVTSSGIDDNRLMVLFDADGWTDMDVTKDITPSFLKFDRNGLDLAMQFATTLSKAQLEWAFQVVKGNMQDLYNSSGYGWDDEDKWNELTEKGARFLLVRSSLAVASEELIGLVHFRFTVQGEVVDRMDGDPCLYVYGDNIHIQRQYQRKGLGRHLFQLLELIARKQLMRNISIPVMLTDEATKAWLGALSKGYAVDASLDALGFDASLEGFQVFMKPFPVITIKGRAIGSTKMRDPPSTISQPETTTMNFSNHAIDTAAASSYDISGDVPSVSTEPASSQESTDACPDPTEESKATDGYQSPCSDEDDIVIVEGDWLML